MECVEQYLSVAPYWSEPSAFSHYVQRMQDEHTVIDQCVYISMLATAIELPPRPPSPHSGPPEELKLSHGGSEAETCHLYRQFTFDLVAQRTNFACKLTNKKGHLSAVPGRTKAKMDKVSVGVRRLGEEGRQRWQQMDGAKYP